MDALSHRHSDGQLRDVWTEFVGLGEGLRDNADDLREAEAIGRETMRRARRNVERLVVELPRFGYVFEPGDGLEVYAPPEGDVVSRVDEIEARVGLIPLAFRWWLEEVGTVNLMGHNPDWPLRYSDPLVVEAPPRYILGEIDAWEDDLGTEFERRPFTIDFSPDRLHKDNVSGGAPYAIAVPCGAADSLVLWERHQTTFVNYLRIAFQHGGFLGFDLNDNDPPTPTPKALTLLAASLERI